MDRSEVEKSRSLSSNSRVFMLSSSWASSTAVRSARSRALSRSRARACWSSKSSSCSFRAWAISLWRVSMSFELSLAAALAFSSSAWRSSMLFLWTPMSLSYPSSCFLYWVSCFRMPRSSCCWAALAIFMSSMSSLAFSSRSSALNRSRRTRSISPLSFSASAPPTRMISFSTASSSFSSSARRALRCSMPSRNPPRSWSYSATCVPTPFSWSSISSRFFQAIWALASWRVSWSSR